MVWGETARRWRTWAALALALALLHGALGGPAAAAPWTPAPFAAAEPPAITAKAAYVLDATAGAPLFALHPDDRLAPASLTKIVTALVVLDHAPLDDPVQIQQSDIVDESQSRVGLLPGDVLTVRDLLYGLLIPSGNDAALALARHVGRSLPPVEGGTSNDAFVAEMNRRTAALGAANTHFANAVGLDADEQYASARDMALLTEAAMQNPTFAEIIATPNTVLPSALKPDGYAIHTTNDLLIEGLVEGGKTGTTENARGCLVTVSHTGGNLIVSVVLGSELTTDEAGQYQSPARFNDVRTMLAALPERYAWIDPAAPDAIPGLAQELSAWNAALAPSGSVPVPVDEEDKLDYRLRLGPPADPGQPVGTALLMVDGELLSEQPLVQAGAPAALLAPTGDVAA